VIRYISCLEYIDIMHKLYKLRNSPWSSVAGNDTDLFPNNNLVWLPESASPLEIYLFILILSSECRRQLNQLYYLNLISFIYLGLFLTFF
jgi:hypothetical protein